MASHPAAAPAVVAPVKETKAQKVERLKRSMNPWDGLAEIRRFAREGFASIPAEWIGTYFRWWGVYTQGDGAGVVGGKDGQGVALPYFMLRIRIPNGLLRSNQLRAIAGLTSRYARGIADLTVRQNIQLHWITIEALPEVLEELWRVGLNTMGACGDVTRNVTGCPVAGVDADEICDASGLALEADRMLAGNAELMKYVRKACSPYNVNGVALADFNAAVADSAWLRIGSRLGADLCPAIQGLGDDAGDGSFADAAMAREDVAVGDAVLFERVHQGAGDVVLAGHVGKALRTIFAGQYLVTHGCLCSSKMGHPDSYSVWGASRRLYRSGVGRRGGSIRECGTAVFEELADGWVAFKADGDFVGAAGFLECAGPG